MKKHIIDDVELVLAEPVEQDLQWIGQEDLVEQILASWLVVGETDLPLCPRLIGKPGVGKTTLAYFAARSLGLPAYIHQCTVDTRPEDLLVTPVLSQKGTISYHASALVSAMIRGAVVILDEANRMSEKSWASLAPLLDHRRYVESIAAGIRIPANPDFRACVTMNEDASTYEIPDYMLSRIQPTVEVAFPERDEEFQILKYHLPFAPEDILKLTVDFLQEGHQHGLGYSTRDGINIIRYACKMAHRRTQKAQGDKPGTPAKKATGPAKMDEEAVDELFHRSVRQILGPDAMDFEKVTLKNEPPKYLDLREFFASVDDLGEDDELGEDDDDLSGEPEDPSTEK